jgi:hypothetical protein
VSWNLASTPFLKNARIITKVQELASHRAASLQAKPAHVLTYFWGSIIRMQCAVDEEFMRHAVFPPGKHPLQIFKALALIINILPKFGMPRKTFEVIAEKSVRIFLFQLPRLHEIRDQLKPIEEAHEIGIFGFQ